MSKSNDGQARCGYTLEFKLEAVRLWGEVTQAGPA